jgi:hypothetical protein
LKKKSKKSGLAVYGAFSESVNPKTQLSVTGQSEDCSVDAQLVPLFFTILGTLKFVLFRVKFIEFNRGWPLRSEKARARKQT